MSKHPKSKLPKRKNTKISSADDLTKTGKSGDIELDEKELEQVSGGATTHENVTVKVGRIEFKV
jgi:bacteriocin-like protein